MFFYIVLTAISTTSGLWSTGNTRKYHQLDVYIYQCDSCYICPKNAGEFVEKNTHFISDLYLFQHKTDKYEAVNFHAQLPCVGKQGKLVWVLSVDHWLKKNPFNF